MRKGGTGQITGRIVLFGGYGAERLAPRRVSRPPQPCPHSAPPLTPLPAARTREGALRAGRKGSTWPGQEAKSGQQHGGPRPTGVPESRVRPSLPLGPAAAPSL